MNTVQGVKNALLMGQGVLFPAGAKVVRLVVEGWTCVEGSLGLIPFIAQHIHYRRFTIRDDRFGVGRC